MVHLLQTTHQVLVSALIRPLAAGDRAKRLGSASALCREAEARKVSFDRCVWNQPGAASAFFSPVGLREGELAGLLGIWFASSRLDCQLHPYVDSAYRASPHTSLNIRLVIVAKYLRSPTLKPISNYFTKLNF